jgi:hypothetical protein
MSPLSFLRRQSSADTRLGSQRDHSQSDPFDSTPKPRYLLTTAVALNQNMPSSRSSQRECRSKTYRPGSPRGRQALLRPFPVRPHCLRPQRAQTPDTKCSTTPFERSAVLVGARRDQVNPHGRVSVFRRRSEQLMDCCTTRARRTTRSKGLSKKLKNTTAASSANVPTCSNV